MRPSSPWYCGCWKRSTDARQECFALDSAGSVGHGIIKKQIGEPIELTQTRRVVVCRRHQGQGAPACLGKCLACKRGHAGRIGDEAVLKARFEPTRMSETSGREAGVDELPDHHRQCRPKRESTVARAAVRPAARSEVPRCLRSRRRFPDRRASSVSRRSV